MFTVTYIGVETLDGALERQLVREVYRRAGVVNQDYPKGVAVEWRDGFWVGVNYTDVPITLGIPDDSRVLVGENPLLPARAVVWK
jgi:beta-galactosidase